MAGPNYGAIGATLKGVRILQVCCLIAIIGMTANFISMIVSNSQTTPSELVGTLSIVRPPCILTLLPNPKILTHPPQTCIAVLYCAITFILFLDNILPFLLATTIDSLLLIALVVVAIVVGKPLSYLNCQSIGTASNLGSAYDFTVSLGNSLNQSGSQLNYNTWVGMTQPACLEMKSIWGLSIALWYVQADIRFIGKHD